MIQLSDSVDLFTFESEEVKEKFLAIKKQYDKYKLIFNPVEIHEHVTDYSLSFIRTTIKSKYHDWMRSNKFIRSTEPVKIVVYRHESSYTAYSVYPDVEKDYTDPKNISNRLESSLNKPFRSNVKTVVLDSLLEYAEYLEVEESIVNLIED